MTFQQVLSGVRQWRFTRARAFDLGVTLVTVAFIEFIARPIYRPYIYKNGINDFHLADTIGNTLGTMATVFAFLFLFGNQKRTDRFIINTVTISVALYELAHPLLGKPIDPWDFAATIVTGGLCHLVYRLTRRESGSQPIA
jgi:hypothetical protein